MKKLIVVIMLMLTGCASYDYDKHQRDKVERLSEQARQKQSNPTHYAYSEAVNHGCNTAFADGGMIGYKAEKNIDQYIKDQYYKAGFDDGFKKCKAEDDRLNDAYRMSAPYRW